MMEVFEVGTITIDRVVYTVTKDGYGGRSVLTVVLKNTIPLPNDYNTTVKFYDKDLAVVSQQSKTGVLMPLGDVEITFTFEGTSTMAGIEVRRLFIPFIKEDSRTVYPG